MERILRILKTLMGLGVLALIAVIVSIIVAQTTTGSSAQGKSTATKVVHPPAGHPPVTPIHPESPPAHGQQLVYGPLCQKHGTNCELALLEMINNQRGARGRTSLALDDVQSSGKGSCAGSAGHTSAMAATGSIWHANPKYPAASYPRDICTSSTHHKEVVISARGATSWQALRKVERHLFRQSRPSHRYLLSRKFSRAGIAIQRSGSRVFVTIDLLG